VADAAHFGAPGYTFTAGFAAAMLGALWGYDGWSNLTFVAGEVKNPNRNIPLAIIGSTILIIFLYVFVHIGYFYVLDPTTIASVSKGSSVAKTVVAMFFGGDPARLATGVGITIFTVGLMLSSLGTLHTSILAGSRVPFAMARDGLMVKSFGILSVTGVPRPLGIDPGDVRFVRHPDRLCRFRVLDLLCAGNDVYLCIPKAIPRR
jgi:amino acid transporter